MPSRFVITLLCVIELVCGLKFVPMKHDTKPWTHIEDGLVQGNVVTINSFNVKAFLGIPFAKPPLGDLRFKKPVKIDSWEGRILDATQKQSPCMQFSNRTDFPWEPTHERPSEDCLYLNVWVPTDKRKGSDRDLKNLPVFVFIFGGGYYSGSASLEMYDGAALAAYGEIIVVSMNYRVGSFGFLYSGTPEAPGNMGMHDQLMALQWVQDNIKHFGGNKNAVTLIGESSGSVSVGYHMISPLSRNLFTRAIMQSGSPYHPLMGQDLTVTKMVDSIFATAAGCADNTYNLVTNPEKVVKCLKEKDAMQLAQIENVFLQKQPFFFLPIHGDDFMPRTAIQALNSGDVKNAELLIGNVKDEGAIFMHYLLPQFFTAKTAPPLNKEMASNIIMGLFQNSTNPPPNAVAEFYLNGVSEPNDILKAVYDSFGDFIFFCPTVFFAERMKNSVFYYMYLHRPSNSKWGEWMGSTHFDDVPFVFGDPMRHNEKYTTAESIFTTDIVEKWVSFATSGSPQLKSLYHENEWPKFTVADPNYKELYPDSATTGVGPHAKACNFWRPFFGATDIKTESKVKGVKGGIKQ